MVASVSQSSSWMRGPAQAVIAQDEIAAASLAHSGHSDADFNVKLSLFSFVLMWIAIAMTHVICIGCFGLQSWVYMQLPLSSLAHSLVLYGVTMAPSNFRVVSVVYAIIAILHGILLLEMLIASLWYRNLRFKIESNWHWRSRPVVQNKQTKGLRACAIRIFDRVAGEHGLLGVKGRYFGVVYVVREIFETVLQSSQAYRMSQFVPRLQVNRFLVATIVMNCWSIPIINYWFARNPPMERMLCLIFDIALDFTSTVGVPVVLAIPYWKQYDFKATNFSGLLYWNDYWFVNMINQLRIVFISSWMNLLTDTIFLVGMLLCLEDVKRLLPSYEKHKRQPKKPNGARNSIKPIETSISGNLICTKAIQDPCN